MMPAELKNFAKNQTASSSAGIAKNNVVVTPLLPVKSIEDNFTQEKVNGDALTLIGGGDLTDLDERFFRTAVNLVGYVFRITTSEGRVFEGILETFDPNFDVALSLAHEVTSNDDSSVPHQGVIKEKMIFSRKNIVTFSTVAEPDTLVNTKGFAVDSEIGQVNGQGSGRELKAWEPDSHPEDSDEHFLDSEVHGEGWNVQDMFERNKNNFGVISTYSDDLTQFSNVEIDGDKSEPEYRARMFHAQRLAQAIEANPASRHAAALENDDEERDIVAAPVDNAAAPLVQPQAHSALPPSSSVAMPPDDRSPHAAPSSGGVTPTGDHRPFIPQHKRRGGGNQKSFNKPNGPFSRAPPINNDTMHRNVQASSQHSMPMGRQGPPMSRGGNTMPASASSDDFGAASGGGGASSQQTSVYHRQAPYRNIQPPPASNYGAPPPPFNPSPQSASSNVYERQQGGGGATTTNIGQAPQHNEWERRNPPAQHAKREPTNYSSGGGGSSGAASNRQPYAQQQHFKNAQNSGGSTQGVRQSFTQRNARDRDSAHVVADLKRFGNEFQLAPPMATGAAGGGNIPAQQPQFTNAPPSVVSQVQRVNSSPPTPVAQLPQLQQQIQSAVYSRQSPPRGHIQMKDELTTTITSKDKPSPTSAGPTYANQLEEKKLQQYEAMTTCESPAPDAANVSTDSVSKSKLNPDAKEFCPTQYYNSRPTPVQTPVGMATYPVGVQSPSAQQMINAAAMMSGQPPPNMQSVPLQLAQMPPQSGSPQATHMMPNGAPAVLPPGALYYAAAGGSYGGPQAPPQQQQQGAGQGLPPQMPTMTSFSAMTLLPGGTPIYTINQPSMAILHSNNGTGYRSVKVNNGGQGAGVVAATGQPLVSSYPANASFLVYPSQHGPQQQGAGQQGPPHGAYQQAQYVIGAAPRMQYIVPQQLTGADGGQQHIFVPQTAQSAAAQAAAAGQPLMTATPYGAAAAAGTPYLFQYAAMPQQQGGGGAASVAGSSQSHGAPGALAYQTAPYVFNAARMQYVLPSGAQSVDGSQPLFITSFQQPYPTHVMPRTAAGGFVAPTGHPSGSSHQGSNGTPANLNN